jgi:protease-4
MPWTNKEDWRRMDVSQIIERRSLRRKLGVWRIVALVFLALVIVLGWLAINGGVISDPRKKDHIARVSITGVIMDDADLVGRLDTIAEDSAVKGLIVSINSPGGTTYGGETIYKAIRRVAAKKPVVSDVRTLAASAGYMIAIAGDRIIAGDTSITGSIGVIFQFPQIKPLLDKIGVSMEEIKSAPLKAEPSPFHEASPEARDAMRSMVMDSFDWFVSLVAERRKLDKQQALKLADGRIYTGRQALNIKLIDEIGGEEAIRTYFGAHKVVKDLPILNWDAPKETSVLGLTGMARQILGWAGFDWLGALQKASDDKMLLDGLVSVWQFDANK